MNPLTADDVDAHTATTEAPPTCLCHDPADCPDQTLVAINAGHLTDIGEPLEVIDEFLRTQPGAADLLTDYFLTDYFLTDYFLTDYFLTDYFLTDYFLTDYFAAQSARAHPPGGLRYDPGYLRGQARYEVNLFIDSVSFTAHALRTHRQNRGGDR